MSTQQCPGCKKFVKGIVRHLQSNRECEQSITVPWVIDTKKGSGARDGREMSDPGRPEGATRSSTRARMDINYSEAAKRKRDDVADDITNFMDEADENLDDYLKSNKEHTSEISRHVQYVQEEDCREEWNTLFTSGAPDNSLPTRKGDNYQWSSIFASDDSVAAVAPATEELAPPNSGRLIQHRGAGRYKTVTMEEQNAQVAAIPQDRSMARIYQTCAQAGAPRYLPDLLMKQLREEHRESNFCPWDAGITQRDAWMHRMSRSVGLKPPEGIPVTLESGQTVTVFRFPFQQSLQQHLVSAVFADLNNLSVNQSDPWGRYTKDGDVLKDFYDGTWYPESYDDYENSIRKDELNQFIFNALIAYVDRTHADGIEKNSVEPVMFISALIRQSQRENGNNWFCAGFLPNLKMISAAARRGLKGSKYTKSASIRDYHRCFQILLEPLKEMQKTKPVMDFRRGDRIKTARVVSPFAALQGDNLSHDGTAGRRADYSITSPRLSRRCLTSFSRSADSVHRCSPVSAVALECLTMGALGCLYGERQPPEDGEVPVAPRMLGYASIPLSENIDLWKQFVGAKPTKEIRGIYVRYRKIRERICTELLHQVFGSHPVDNAFFGLDCGRNKGGIFRAALADILHTIEEGLIPKFLEVVFGLMPDKQRAVIDHLVETLFANGHNRSGERNLYPRVSFTRGYTQLTRLSANERQGQLFVICILLQTRSGREALRPRFAFNFDEKRRKAKERLAASKKERESGNGAGNNANPNGGDEISDEGGEEDEVEESDRESEKEDEERREETGAADGVEEEEEEEKKESDEEEQEEEEKKASDEEEKEEDSDDDSDSLDGEVKEHLDRLDLSYLHQGVHPYLDEFHKRRFEGVLDSILTESGISKIARVQMPPDLLDYRTVDRPTKLERAQESAVEIEHPDLQITEERQENSLKLPMEEFVHLVETIISLIAFLKNGCNLLVSTKTGSDEYDKALELLMRRLVSTVERASSTNQWFLQKSIELMHFKQDILAYGPASGFSTETGERNLKPWAKQPAKTAQRRGDKIFTRQVCERLHESAIISSIARCGPPREEEEPTVIAGEGVRAGGTRFVVELRAGSRAVAFRLGANERKHKIQLDMAEEIVAWFEKKYPTEEEAQTSIRLFSELGLPQRKGDKKTLLRAHPNYRSEGAWHDYALATYKEVGRHDMEPVYACKLACFFIQPITGRMMALVQEVTYQTGEQRKRESQLFNHWTMNSKRNAETRRWDAVFTALPVEALSDRIYVIDSNPVDGFSREEREDFDVLVVKYRKEEWPLSFLKSPEYLKCYEWS
jgi:hypothetical protein